MGIKFEDIKYHEEFDTVGGSALMGLITEEAHVKVIVEDRDTPWVKCYIIIN